MQELNRIKVGEFSIDTAITLEELEKNSNDAKYIEDKIVKIEDIFKKCETITLNSKDMGSFFNGVKLRMKRQDGIYKIYNEEGIFIGIGNVSMESLKRDVIL